MKHYNFILTACLVLLSACSFQGSDEERGSASEFDFLAPTVIQIQTLENDSLGFPSKKRFELRVCLVDKALANRRAYEKVKLAGGVEVFEGTTDAEGCFRWQESFSFSYFSNEKIIKLERRIESGGNIAAITFGLDFWRNSSDALFDAKTLNGEITNEKLIFLDGQSPNLLVSDVVVSSKLNPSESGYENFVVQASFTMEALRKTHDGLVREPLSTGKFQVRLAIAENASSASNLQVIARSDFTDCEIKGGRLTVNSPEWKIPAEYFINARNRDLAFLYEIRPTDSTSGLLSHQGRKPIGKTLVHLEMAGPGISEKVKSGWPTASLASPPVTLPAEAGFSIYKIDLHFMDHVVESPEEWTASALVKLEVCLRRTVGQTVVEPGHPFQLKFQPTSPIGNVKVDDPVNWKSVSVRPEGCIDWVEKINYPIAVKKLAYLSYQVSVKSRLPEFADIVRTQTVYLDPWNNEILLHWNEAVSGVPAISQPGPLQLELSALGNVTVAKLLGREVYVESSLNLRFKYRYQFSLRPNLFRPVSLNKEKWKQSLLPGTRFHLRGALLAVAKHGTAPSPYQAYDVISKFETELIAGDAGELEKEISIEIALTDEPFLDSRTRLVLDLEPSRLSSPLPLAISVVSPFDLRQEQAVLQTSKSPLSTIELTTKASVAKVDPYENILDSLRLKRENVNRFGTENDETRISKLNLSTADLKTALAEQRVNPILLASFHALYESVPTASQREAFVKNPEQHVRISFFEYVSKFEMDSSPAPSNQYQSSYETLSVLAGISKETAESQHTADGSYDVEKTTVHGEMKRRGRESMGTGYGEYWDTHNRNEKFKQVEVVASRVVSQNQSYQKIQNFYVDKLRVDFKAWVVSCLLIEMGKLGTSKTPAYVFCGPEELKSVSDAWYYITDEYRTNVFSFLDTKNLNERQIVRIFRGDAAYLRLVSAMSNESKNYEIRKTDKELAKATDPSRMRIAALESGELPPGTLHLKRGTAPFEIGGRKLCNQIESHGVAKASDLFSFFMDLSEHPEKLESKRTQYLLNFFDQKTRSNFDANRAYVELLELLYEWI